MSAQGNLVIGHELNVYRGTNLEYFSLVNGKPSRLKFIDIAGDYIKKNYPGHYVRIKSLDIENLIYSVKLAKHTDASCCPTLDKKLSEIQSSQWRLLCHYLSMNTNALGVFGNNAQGSG